MNNNNTSNQTPSNGQCAADSAQKPSIGDHVYFEGHRFGILESSDGLIGKINVEGGGFVYRNMCDISFRLPPQTRMKEKLIDIIVDSQDGKPRKSIIEECVDGRLISVCDNLNRLLADAINNAVDTGDIDTLMSDLDYATEQLRRASLALQENVVNAYKKFGPHLIQTRNDFMTV